MASSVESSIRPNPRFGAQRGWLAVSIALVLSVAAGGGATWLLAVGPARPWEDAFAELGNTSDLCRLEGDATAHSAAQGAQIQGQLDSFVRQRFDQILAEARLAQEKADREAELRFAGQRPDSTVAQAAQIEARLAELVGERSRLLERLTPQHPTVVDTDRQIADLNQQLAALASAATLNTGSGPAAPDAETAPAADWKDLVERSVVEYDQLAASSRRAERQFEEAQIGQSTALDRHLTALGHWSDESAEWGKLFVTPVALSTILWIVAAASIAVLGWLVARGMSTGIRSGTDRLITSAGQIERWFSLPVVAISAAGDETRAPVAARRRPASRWLVLPAQLVVALAVFCLVATTIQNPSWFGNLWAR